MRPSLEPPIGVGQFDDHDGAAGQVFSVTAVFVGYPDRQVILRPIREAHPRQIGGHRLLARLDIAQDAGGVALGLQGRCERLAEGFGEAVVAEGDAAGLKVPGESVAPVAPDPGGVPALRRVVAAPERVVPGAHGAVPDRVLGARARP